MAQLYFNFNENHTIFDFTKNAFLLMQQSVLYNTIYRHYHNK